MAWRLRLYIQLLKHFFESFRGVFAKSVMPATFEITVGQNRMTFSCLEERFGFQGQKTKMDVAKSYRGPWNCCLMA